MSEQPKKIKTEDFPLQISAISLRFDGKTLHAEAEPLEQLHKGVPTVNIKSLAQFATQYAYYMLNRGAIEYQAWRESEIMRIWMVLSIQHTKPAYEQVKALVEDIEMNTNYTTESLYKTLATGFIPSGVGAIIKRHEQGWAPIEEVTNERG